jgi:hypothetical protein
MKHIYCHETCATDTNQVQAVLDSVLDAMLERALHDSGMM